MYEYYRIVNESDSNPNRELKRETIRGPLGMLFMVYLPIIILVMFLRMSMLYTGYAIVKIPIVDAKLTVVLHEMELIKARLGS